MFATFRTFPLKGLALVALGFFLATAFAGSAGSAVGTAIGIGLFLPFLLLKLLFMFFLFGMLLRFVGGGWGGSRWRRGPWGSYARYSPYPPRRGGDRTGGGWASDGHTEWRYRGRPMRPTPPAPSSPDQAEWQEHLREARREVDDLDAPYRDDPDFPPSDRDPSA